MPENVPPPHDEGHQADPNLEQALDHVSLALRGLRFGEIRLVVQDGVVIQIERTEKKRLPKTPKRR